MEFIKENIYYLNVNELTKMCDKLSIPYNVYYIKNNELHKTNLIIRKRFIIENILKKLENKKTKMVTISETNVNFNELKKPKLSDKIYFGQFKWAIGKKLLINCKPAICFFMLYDLWQKNKNFTYSDFIKYYQKNSKNYEEDLHPEWKYIEYIREGNDNKLWHKTRNSKAKIVMEKIDKMNKFIK